MSHTDLDAAAAAARRLVSMVAMIRNLPAAGANDSTIKQLYAELNQILPAAQNDIKAVVIELRRLRNSPVHLGDITAPTAHEVAKEMVFALNREQFGVESIGRNNVQVWPDVSTVIAEIELETTKARQFRDTAERSGDRKTTQGKRRGGRPKKTEKDSATKVVAALNAHHGYGANMSVTNFEPATNRRLAEKFDLSENALSRFLKDRGGHKKYFNYCRNGKIGYLLALWNRELPQHLPDLRPEESGRREDD